MYSESKFTFEHFTRERMVYVTGNQPTKNNVIDGIVVLIARNWILQLGKKRNVRKPSGRLETSV